MGIAYCCRYSACRRTVEKRMEGTALERSLLFAADAANCSGRRRIPIQAGAARSGGCYGRGVLDEKSNDVFYVKEKAEPGPGSAFFMRVFDGGGATSYIDSG